MRTNYTITTIEFRDVSYADIPSTKARLLARGYKVDEISVSKDYCWKYIVCATRVK